MTPTNRIRTMVVTFSTALIAAFSSCGDTMTYSDYQDKEEESIENFIKTKNKCTFRAIVKVGL